jgi:hypothetical protein
MPEGHAPYPRQQVAIALVGLLRRSQGISPAEVHATRIFRDQSSQPVRVLLVRPLQRSGASRGLEAL